MKPRAPIFLACACVIIFVMRVRHYFVMRVRHYFVMRVRHYFVMRVRHYFVIPSEARNLSFFSGLKPKRDSSLRSE